MKDFTAADHLTELVDANVSSLKIEGRMKGPLYVAAVTDFYRKSLAGEMKNPEQALSDIQTLFGRPSTDLYLSDSADSPIDPVNDGHRGAQIGTVKGVINGWLILHTNRALQKHDGLKVEAAGTHAYGFAANQMRFTTDSEHKRHFELPANAEIALRLPPDAPRLEKGAPVYCSFSQVVRQRYSFSAPRPGQYRQRRPVDIRVFQSLEKMKITASADGIETAHTLPGPFEPAKQPEKAAAALRKCFEKLGDTDWQLGNLTIEGPAVFAPMSVLNEARRQLIDDFSKKAEPSPIVFSQSVETFPKSTAAPDVFWSVKMRVFQALEDIDEFVLEIDPAKPEEIKKASALYSEKLRLALPVIIREDEVEAFKKLIDQFSDIEKWEAANVGGLQLLKDKQDITAEWPLYTLNTQAALEWKTQGVRQFVLSPEDQEENLLVLIRELGDSAVIPVYQHTPLMISATKPAADGSKLIDRSNRAFRVESNGRQFIVVNEIPFSLTGKLNELQAAGAHRFRIDLCYSDHSTAKEIVQNVIAGRTVAGHTGNLNGHLH
jgi:putative protease